MVTWAQHLAATDRQWAIIVRIEGVGPFLNDADLTAADDDARYRFCIAVPSYASSQPSMLWRPYLTEPFPQILTEEVDPFGGFPKLGTISVSILDVDNFLTQLLRTEAAAATALTEDLDAAETAIDVGSGARVNDDSVAYVGGEAFRVTSISSNTVTADRGYLGTIAAPHVTNDRVRAYIPNVLGRRLTLHVAPLNGDSTADERLVGEYVIDGMRWDRNFNAYVFHGKSQLKYLDRALPRESRVAELVNFHPNQSAPHLIEVRTVAGADIIDWAHWTGSQADDSARPAAFFFRRGGAGGPIAAGRAPYRTLFELQRGEVVSSPDDPLEVGDLLTQVFVADPTEPAASFRWAPGPSPETDLTANGWLVTAHWVDIILSLLTSPSTAFDGFAPGENYDATYGNWSVLPVGYGLGVPAALIDFASFVDVRNRTADFIFPYFVYGDEESQSAATLISDHFLRPMGAYFSLDSGTIRLILPRLPTLDEVTTTIGHDEILAVDTEPGVRVPESESSINSELHASGVKYLVGPDRVPITFNSGEFADTYGQRGSYVSDDQTVVIPVPGGSPRLRDLYAQRAQARLFRLHKPNVELEQDVDAGTNGWAAVVGSLVAVTLGEIPDRANGTRGWTEVIADVLAREVRIDSERGVHIHQRLLAYTTQARVGRVTPAARVSAVAANVATVLANRYTATDAQSPLPNADAEIFQEDDFVILANPDGSIVDPVPEQVLNVTGNDITLSGDFSGALATGLLLIFGNYDDVDPQQRVAYAFAADRANQTVDASNDAPYVYGEL